MMKIASTAVALAAVLCFSAAPAEARRKVKQDADTSSDDAAPAKSSKKTKADKTRADKTKAEKDKSGKVDPAKPVQVATFGDWGAYLAKGKSKTCYTLASPKERKPENKRASAYVFIADRPADKVHNEVSIIMGFPLKEGAPAQAKVGNTDFDLVAKGSNAWIKNQADEAKFVDALRRAPKLVVKAAPARGPATTDTYVLTGFKQALERVTKECK